MEELHQLNQEWLSPHNLQLFANTVSEKYKKVCAIKFQSVATPNGMIANPFGPVESRRHDSGMLGDSGLLNELRQYARGPEGNTLCIYGDPAYPLRPRTNGTL